jgi:hypothetical protein
LIVNADIEAGVMTASVQTNAGRLLTTRLVGVVQQPSAHVSVDPDGFARTLPGMGGVFVRPRIGDRAGGWMSDHLEVGASVWHPEPSADHALQVLACVGNRAQVIDGPAAGGVGTVVGKHASTMVSFSPDVLAALAPGERITIDAVGVGLRIEHEPDIVFHSCSPVLLPLLAPSRLGDGRVVVKVARVLPPEAAAAGIGMAAHSANLDLQVDQLAGAAAAADLRFGDLVALEGHDHRLGRQPRDGWLAVGAICHGRSVGGGHGLGLVTLLSAPADRLGIQVTPDASLVGLALPGAGA